MRGVVAGTVRRVDSAHGSPFSAWLAMGRPDPPSNEQRAQLADAARIAPTPVMIRNGRMKLLVPRQGVVLVELEITRSGPNEQ